MFSNSYKLKSIHNYNNKYRGDDNGVTCYEYFMNVMAKIFNGPLHRRHKPFVATF